MSKQILSETITIDKPEKVTVQSVENILKDKFGDVLRWAIIETGENTFKICLTYEK